MYLAIQEIRREKLRFGLIVTMIVLVSFLVFILNALAVGLAQKNTAAIKSWNISHAVLSQEANQQLRGSFLTANQVQSIDGDPVGLSMTSLTAGDFEESVNFLGLQPGRLADTVPISAGRMSTSAGEVVLGQELSQHIPLGTEVTLGSLTESFRVVGFADKAQLSVSSVVYGSLEDWQRLQRTDAFAASFVAADHPLDAPAGTTVLDTQTVINNLPGYKAQNLTFSVMIGFLAVITLIVIAVFLYMVTAQKLPNIAVLRIQGIPGIKLARSAVLQSVMLMGSGVVLALALFSLTYLMLPSAVPVSINPVLFLYSIVGLLLIGVVGATLPARTILRSDPMSLLS